MKKISVFVSAFVFLITLTFSSPHHEGYKKATDEQAPPSGTTTITD